MMENGCDRVDEVIENKASMNYSAHQKMGLSMWSNVGMTEKNAISKRAGNCGVTTNSANLHKVLRGPIDFGEESETFVMEGEDLRKEYAKT